MGFPSWQAPSSACSGGPTPGAKALMAVLLQLGKAAKLFNLGIYNCRLISGSTSRSVHGDGRALDVGVPGSRNPDGTKLVKRLLPHVGKLGVQTIIWNRTIWSAKSPSGRPYLGVHPHFDHVHIELTRDAAKRLTQTTVRTALSVTPARVPGTVDLSNLVMAARTEGRDGGDSSVEIVQRSLGGLDVDGIFGKLTRKKYAAWQRSVGFDAAKATGIPEQASLDRLAAKHGFAVKP